MFAYLRIARKAKRVEPIIVGSIGVKGMMSNFKAV
jgi:hypothetical protein